VRAPPHRRRPPRGAVRTAAAAPLGLMEGWEGEDRRRPGPHDLTWREPAKRVGVANHESSRGTAPRSAIRYRPPSGPVNSQDSRPTLSRTDRPRAPGGASPGWRRQWTGRLGRDRACMIEST
jgi:hypothetical protein